MFELNKKHPLYQEDLKNILKTDLIDNVKGKRILITGSTGLIGTQLIDALMLLGDVDIYAVGRNRDKAKKRFSEYFDSPKFTFIEHDILSAFPEKLKVDYIIPFASNTHPLAYSKFPVETMFVNLKGAENALNLARHCNATVLYPSSNEIYGNEIGNSLFSEGDTGQLDISTARACYTESKRSSEALCQSYASEYGTKVIIARLTRTFGPSVLPTDTKASSQFIQKALAHEDIVLKSKGDQFFSYTYVADAISALLFILLHGKNANAYNISNEKCNVYLKDFAQTCANYARTKVIFDLPTDAETKGYSIAKKAILDNRKLLNLGWKPLYSFQNAIWRTLEILSDSGNNKE
ncbi:MAG: NAD-dependent epimerase/dehydratase family protein [Prevotella sp.]|jgi:nucleoside-diphosphate-sugar epimerase|nr:NAD-dependent epimerase/dehydratase family protein [Prevotella sp.]MCI1802648.1 NAD-dependent epimerase/dehydratase family protein [Prevotella sp.]MCI1817508.1 NAD-dependent epimerase/dehydratase family protein [Prevotella sp.]MCI1848631.1 NAD-dependent epimerase/dehydratase family protein [Prevotella sp.]